MDILTISCYALQPPTWFTVWLMALRKRGVPEAVLMEGASEERRPNPGDREQGCDEHDQRPFLSKQDYATWILFNNKKQLTENNSSQRIIRQLFFNEWNIHVAQSGFSQANIGIWFP